MYSKCLPLLCVLFAAFPCFLLAQSSSFKAGYIVTATDTIQGYLKEDIESNLINGVTFSQNSSGIPAQAYSASNMQAFYFNEGSLFQRVSFTDSKGMPQQQFAKLLVKGYYNLYAFRQTDQQYFLISNRDTSMLLYDDRMLSNGQREEKGNFKNLLHFLSLDCSQLSNELDRLNYSEKSLMAYTSNLNDCKAPGANSTSYYVKAKSKVNIYAYAGALPMGKKAQYAGRLGARFSLPSISKKIFMNAGVNYQRRIITEKHYSIYTYRYTDYPHTTEVSSASFTIQNNFTTGTIQPYIEAGLGFAHKIEVAKYDNTGDFQPKTGIDIIVAAGVEGYINQHLAVKVDWRYELVVNYPAVGIAYFF